MRARGRLKPTSPSPADGDILVLGQQPINSSGGPTSYILLKDPPTLCLCNISGFSFCDSIPCFVATQLVQKPKPTRRNTKKLVQMLFFQNGTLCWLWSCGWTDCISLSSLLPTNGEQKASVHASITPTADFTTNQQCVTNPRCAPNTTFYLGKAKNHPIQPQIQAFCRVVELNWLLGKKHLKLLPLFL